MWLIVSSIATAVAGTAYFTFGKFRKKYKLGLLTLLLLGITIMVLVDHLIAFFSGEPFIQITTEGLIQNGVLLGLAMLAPIAIIWLIVIAVAKRTSV
ncbi:MAG: hypothetical protein V1725_05040 [archaeon]